ncbi:MAG TPA: serine/threonine-protein kinase [Polyangiaceae bacterium]|jgi:serine/threonine protein kinase
MSQPQTLKDGRYAVTGQLGEGAQGSTLDAVDKLRGRAVAVKRFVVKGAESWKDVELAEREARVLSTLSHPGLPVYVDHFEEAGCLYLVMEKIEGRSLDQFRRQGGRLSQHEVMRFLKEIGAILDYLQSRSPPVVHRDIKPSNVVRRPDGSFALVDFGAVRDNLKPEGSTVVGTFGYMAPEQFQGRARPASDVYSVGATALNMLTGMEPEAAPHRGLAIDVPAALAGQASPHLVSVLKAMLEPDPDQRAQRILPLLDAQSSAFDHREHPEEQTSPEWTLPELPEELLKNPVVITLVMLCLSLTALVIWCALQVFLPIVLRTLSLILGHRLREAAAQSVSAGRRAQQGIDNARRELRRASASTSRARGPRVRSGPAPGKRVRVVDTMAESVESDQGPSAAEAPRPKRARN